MRWKFVFSLMFFVALIGTINAADDLCVDANVASISPSSIGINEEFTIGVQIENCGSVMPDLVSFELINPPKDIEIKEPLKINISKLYYANSERFIVYHMKTKSNAIPGTYVLKTRLSYGKNNLSIKKDSEINFDVIGSKSELGISTIKTDPVLPVKDETVELTMRIENSGEGTAKSVKVYADHSFKGLKQSFIGTLESGEDGPAILTFIVDETGEHTFPVTISYTDDFGEGEIKTNISLSVLEKPSNTGVIIFIIIIILIAIISAYYIYKMKKSKDKIIHQLLKGDNSKKNND